MRKLTHPSVINGIACFAITYRLSSSFLKKVLPRSSMMLLTSVIVLSSSLGLAKVMKQMNKALAEQTDVIGFPLFFSVSTADSIDFTSSWIVVTTKRVYYERFFKITKLSYNLFSPGPSARIWLPRCRSTCSCFHRWLSGNIFQSLDHSYFIIFINSFLLKCK